MNKQRRKQIAKALELISEAKTILEEVKDEEESCYDNMTDGLQDTELAEQLQENVEQLGDYIDALEDMSELENM